MRAGAVAERGRGRPRSADFFLTRVALLTLLSREFGKEIAGGGPAAFECRACSARAGLDAFNRGAVVIETDDDLEAIGATIAYALRRESQRMGRSGPLLSGTQYLCSRLRCA